VSGNFDQIIDRRHSQSEKWCRYDEDVLPLWVADMDFMAPEAVIQALRERVEYGVFGYCGDPPELREVVQERLVRLYNWHVEADAIFFVPGVMPGVNQACHALARAGDDILVEVPVYPPLFRAPENAHCNSRLVPLAEEADRYVHDFDAIEAAISGHTSMFLLCSPHNPVGRVFDRNEVERLAEICLRHDIVICADEIHSDIVFAGQQHIPTAALSPEVAARCVTIFAPSKTFNIPGLYCSVGVIQNPDLRARFESARQGLVPTVNSLGLVAALAAYQHGAKWLEDLLSYLEENRDYLRKYLTTHMPAIKCKQVEGTFLAWLDCRALDIPGERNPHQFFLEDARVALNNGAQFGTGGEGFVRLNFGCPRATLVQALERMCAALDSL